jgi:soluble lytic murein transglycosylase-like protein
MIRLLFWAFLLAPTITLAAEGSALEDHFDAPCERYGVPKALALAIASHESGLRPYALNLAGRPVLTATRDQALEISQKALAAGMSFDIGVMQINSWWIKRFGLPLDVVLDPAGNVQVGVWILGQEIKRYGLSWQAVASYHTPLDRNPARGQAYAAAVLGQLQALNSSPARFSVVDPGKPANRAVRSAPILVKRFRDVATNGQN